MEYPKKIMSTPELIQMGFPRRYLERAYHSKSNTFATKIAPNKVTSTILFDTGGFEEWRQKEIAAQKGEN